MEILKSTKVDWKKLTVVTLLIILACTAVGLGVWYYMSQETRNQAEYYEDQLDRQGAPEKVEEYQEEEAEEEAVATADWKTYTNKNYKISFKYPDGYQYTEPYYEDKLRVQLLNDQYFSIEGEVPYSNIEVYPKKGSDLMTWLKASDFYESIIGNIKSVKIAGLDGYYFQSSGMVNVENYVFQNENNTYAVHATSLEQNFPLELLVNSVKFN